MYPTDPSQDDCPMKDALDFQTEAAWEPQSDVGPENPYALAPSVGHEYTPGYHLGVLHSSVMDQLPPVAPHQVPQDFHAIAPSLNSAWDYYGHHVPQPPGNWKFTQTPQFFHDGLSCAVCPTPTSLPSVPHLTIGNNGAQYQPFLPAAGFHNLRPLLACDHANCYPPSDVRYLSRRFPENEHWNQARALAVASLPHTIRGSESFCTAIKASRDNETDGIGGTVYSLPVEILEMILEHLPAIDNLTNLGAGEAALQTCDRHKAFLALSATNKRLRQIFYLRSWITRVAPRKHNFLALNGFFNQIEVPFYTLFVE
jgi:hypothetical protein